MEFTLGIIKSSQQFALRHFNESGELSRGEIHNLEELENHNCQCLFVSNELLENSEILATLTEEEIHTPLRPTQHGIQNIEDLDSLDITHAQTIYSKNVNQWVIQNNLKLLEGLFPTLTHLKGLWPNDRTSFFEELWFIIKRNIGAHDLKIIFNHMIKGKKEGDKNRLVKVIVEGKRVPNPVENNDLGNILMKNYKDQFLNSWEVKEFDQIEGKFTCLALINKSPVLIMGKAPQLTALQTSLLKALFDGLQDNLLH